MDALGQLTGGIAHDFNNQLGIVNGYLELLGEANESNPQARSWITTSRKATRCCIDLTRQLLNFSRQQQMNTEVIDLAEEIMSLKELIQRTVTPAIEVRYEISDKLWSIKSSRGDLEDALLNLIINSRDAMPDGGKLIIGLNNEVLGENEFDNQNIQSGDYVCITIGDTGTGIPKEIQEHVFDPFYSTKDVGKGTGLGLSMIYGFMNRNQGHIHLYSEPGEGTHINLYFPRSEKEHAQPVKKINADELKPSGQNETILIVDDEESLRELAAELLRAQGYQVLTAENGNEALTILAGEQPVDLLFSDVVMPGGMNGYQLVEKARGLRANIKIQLTTGLADISPGNTQQPIPTENILQKPYSRSNLINYINKIFSH